MEVLKIEKELVVVKVQEWVRLQLEEIKVKKVDLVIKSKEVSKVVNSQSIEDFQKLVLHLE